MARQMRTSDKGVELIKSFEGFRARASRLPDGRWLIGYGHTETARAGLTVGAFDAELILRFHDLKRVEDVLYTCVFTPLSQNEFDALASFVFNIGPEAFESSDVLACLNSGDRILASEAMMSWRRGRVDGQPRIIDALARRRAAEIALFLSQPNGPVAIPGALVRPERDPHSGPAVPRETPIIVEARTEADRLRAARPVDRETAPQAAARAVAERLTRILGENASRASGEQGAQESGDPTVDEITRAVSALADPEGTNEAPSPASMSERRRQARQSTPEFDASLSLEPLRLPETDRRLIDDLAPIYVDPAKAEPPLDDRPLGFDKGQGNLRWVPFALLAGLGMIGLYDGMRRFVGTAANQMGQAANQSYAGPLIALGSGFLLFVSVYYLYRMLAEQE
ncbi:MAG: lysozyme [Alphaproteobacteria bacterium]|nr:lysozyme [Alphaproteobacteria bacterium]|tara:strand:- start:81 stop:1271 length:1191 start_codon:yes stop_codon:yes gene_type:complete